jgi:hypothetical protein
MLRRVDWSTTNKMLDDRVVFIFRAKQYKNSNLLGLVDREDGCNALLRSISNHIPATRCSIQEDFNFYQHCWDKLKSVIV